MDSEPPGKATSTDDSSTGQKEAVTMTAKSDDENNPFEEYMWMGDPKEEDEVNLQVLEEIIEEEFIESCFEDMLEEEALGLFSPPDEQDEEGSDPVPSLQNLSLDSGAGTEVEYEGEGHPEEWRGREDVGEPVSGFGVHSSDGESETSDSDSLGDTPQR